MSEARLHNTESVSNALRTAVQHLKLAGDRALYSEGKRDGLIGTFTLLIGGLTDAVAAVADAVEERP